MNMNVNYWLTCEEKEQCFRIFYKGTVFEKEPAHITAYEVCKGLNEYYSDDGNMYIPLRDACTGKYLSERATTGVIGSIDKMITWLREKHNIFYYPAINLCVPLEEPLSNRVKRFWEGEDARQKQIEDLAVDTCGSPEKIDSDGMIRRSGRYPWGPVRDKMHNQYVTHDVTADVYSETQHLKKERDELKEERDNLVDRLKDIDECGYGCSGCKRTTCGYFSEILSSLGIKEVAVCPPRGRSRVETLAKLANERAQVIFKENQTLMQQVDSFINTVNEDKDKIESLSASLRTIKDVVEFETIGLE